MRRFHRAAAAVILVYAALLAIRFTYALISPALTTSFVQDPFQIGMFVVSMVYGYALTMALVLVLFRERQVELADLAEQDPLTGLFNRLSLEHIAEREMQRSLEQRAPLSLLLIDLDHFKEINDRFGHQAGDRVLCRAADVIEEVIRDSDFAFRYGGEEFMVLLPGVDSDQAEQVAERLRDGNWSMRYPPRRPSRAAARQRWPARVLAGENELGCLRRAGRCRFVRGQAWRPRSGRQFVRAPDGIGLKTTLAFVLGIA